MDQDSNKNAKKTILLITGAVLLVAILAVITTVILKSINTSPSAQTSKDQDVSKQAEAEYNKAQEALTKGKLQDAKTSFEKAQELYKQTSDKTHLKEIDAALSLIDHTDDQETTSMQQAPAASISTSELKNN